MILLSGACSSTQAIEETSSASRRQVEAELAFTANYKSIPEEVTREDNVSALAHDMAPLAHDLGYDGSPFLWDEEERHHLPCSARHALLPLLRPIQGRRRLRTRHLPHPPPRRQVRLRPLPHSRDDAILHEHAGGGDTKTVVAELQEALGVEA